MKKSWRDLPLLNSDTRYCHLREFYHKLSYQEVAEYIQLVVKEYQKKDCDRVSLRLVEGLLMEEFYFKSSNEDTDPFYYLLTLCIGVLQTNYAIYYAKAARRDKDLVDFALLMRSKRKNEWEEIPMTTDHHVLAGFYKDKTVAELYCFYEVRYT